MAGVAGLGQTRLRLSCSLSLDSTQRRAHLSRQEKTAQSGQVSREEETAQTWRMA